MVRHVAVYSKTVILKLLKVLIKKRMNWKLSCFSVKMIALLFRLMWHDVTNGLCLKKHFLILEFIKKKKKKHFLILEEWVEGEVVDSKLTTCVCIFFKSSYSVHKAPTFVESGKVVGKQPNFFFIKGIHVVNP